MVFKFFGGRMQPENRLGSGLLLAGMLVGAGFCFWRITLGNPTQNEALLLSFLLTIFSVAGSWIASQYYSAFSFNRNQRVFALKAAEKVTNLSNEFDRLAVFLQQELKESEYDNPQEALLAKNIRIESAVHIINTLKSVNEKSLSDWQGVIGEEISAKREEQEEREDTIRELLERVDSLQHEELERNHYALRREEVNEGERRLRGEVGAIKEELKVLTAQVTGVPVKRLRKRRETITKPCSCGALLQYTQKTAPNNVKGVTCKKCGTRFVSRESNGEFVLQARQAVLEQLDCPACQSKFSTMFDPLPGSSQHIQCSSCETGLDAIRTSNGIRVQMPSSTQAVVRPPLTEEFLQQVGQRMGAQPWPKGQAKIAAEGLEVSTADVNVAIQELIRRGIFKPQIDGRLYVPENSGVGLIREQRKNGA